MKTNEKRHTPRHFSATGQLSKPANSEFRRQPKEGMRIQHGYFQTALVLQKTKVLEMNEISISNYQS